MYFRMLKHWPSMWQLMWLDNCKQHTTEAIRKLDLLQPNSGLFVDDITVASRRKPKANNNPSLQQAISEICDAANNDHMLINGATCSTMHITARSNTHDFTNITARETEIIPHVTARKLLGVVIQNKLKWDQQIDSMEAKVKPTRASISSLSLSALVFSSTIWWGAIVLSCGLCWSMLPRLAIQDSPSNSLMSWSR